MAILDIFKQRVYRPLVLLILDGWGNAPSWGGNAISLAQKPNFDYLWRIFPHTEICASGICVGLPGHEVGNSEVGHLNLGAGRNLFLDVSRINKSIEDGTFFKNEAFFKVARHVAKTGGKVHLMGLLSNGGIHSHINHLFSLIDLMKRLRVERVYIHPILDGRDTPKTQALIYIEKLEEKIKELGMGKIATLAGRFYAMDRDRRWERTQAYYQALVEGKVKQFKTAEQAISYYYRLGFYDETIPPSLVDPQGLIQDNDAIIFFNFRSDRARQITQAFLEEDFRVFARKKLKNILLTTFVPYFNYDVKLPALFAFKPEPINNSLAQVISQKGLTQLHLAETEKYAHVTYFFNGSQEKPFPRERNILIPSPKVLSYDQAPEMSAYKITDTLIENLAKKQYHFILVNFANCDMVGHTGNINATIDAVSHVDKCLGKIWPLIQKLRGILIVTADHGNAEQMLNPLTSEIDPEHTNNPVPFILANFYNPKTPVYFKNQQALKNVAPLILDLFKLPKPSDMNAESLFSNQPQPAYASEVKDNYWSV